MARFDLTDFEWSVIQPLLPTKVRGVKRVDDRRVLNGIFWRLRTGAPWADIPARYGPHGRHLVDDHRHALGRGGDVGREEGEIDEAGDAPIQPRRRPAPFRTGATRQASATGGRRACGDRPPA